MADLGNRTNVNSAIDLLLDDLAPDNSILPSDHNGLLKDILDTLANGLSVTLRTGNTTSGQNLQVTSGDSIQFDNSTFLGSLSSATLTGNQSYSLPDKSGTIALTSEASILAVDSQTLGGNYSHDLASNTLTFNNGTINIITGGMGVVGSTNVTSDGVGGTISSFISSTGHQTLILSDTRNAVAVGISTPDLSALVDFTSTTKGFLKPRLTTTQRNAIGSPALALEIFNTTTNQTEFYNGSSWVAIGGGSTLYSSDDTIGSGRIATLTDTLKFDGGTVKLEGADTLSTSSVFELFDNDTTPFKWLDGRNDGRLLITRPSGATTNYAVEIDVSSAGTGSGGVEITAGASNFGLTIQGDVNRILNTHKTGGNNVISLGDTNGSYLFNVLNHGTAFGGGEFANFVAGSSGASFGQVILGYGTNYGLVSGGDKPIKWRMTGSNAHWFDNDGSIHVGAGSIADGSALLEMTSTTRGFLQPRMTTTQRDAISTPATGLMVYNTTTNKLNFYNGSAWEVVTSA